MLWTGPRNTDYGISFVRLILAGVLFFTVFPACTSRLAHKADPVSTQQPSPADAAALKPGLAVYYMAGFWRHVDQMPTVNVFVEKGSPGKPIFKIDHQFKNNAVFDSGLNSGVGVQMMGVIHLPEPGEWQFRAQSNDGIRVFINTTAVVSDPEWHADRFSEPMRLTVTKPGWHAILLRYFQRKGTATLESYWKPPGKNEFTIIPEAAYGHFPSL